MPQCRCGHVFDYNGKWIESRICPEHYIKMTEETPAPDRIMPQMPERRREHK